MPDQADLQLVRAINYTQQQHAAIRRQLLAFIERTWMGLGSWRDADAARWANMAIPAVNGAAQQTAALQAAQQAMTATLATGQTVRPVAVSPTDVTTEALRGVTATEVYGRPAVSTWTALSERSPLDQAVQAGLRRALSIASTDVQLAKTHTARRAMQDNDRVVGFRRTLTGSENCGLCAVASTQRYRSGTLSPIHPGCDCGVAEIYGDRDPGRVINQPRLDATHEAILDTFGHFNAGSREINPGSVDPTKYRDVLIVQEHGEVGPVLTVRGQTFTGPDDL